MFWWKIEFLFSFMIFIFLGPPLGSWLRRHWSKSASIEEYSLESSSIDYILGFTAINFAASFLLPLHRLGLPLLCVALGLICIRQFRQKKLGFMSFHWTDLVVIAPVIYAMYALPVTVDSNLRDYQFAL